MPEAAPAQCDSGLPACKRILICYDEMSETWKGKMPEAAPAQCDSGLWKRTHKRMRAKPTGQHRWYSHMWQRVQMQPKELAP